MTAKSVRFSRTLEFYDWILMFEATDETGNTYIGFVRNLREETYMLVQYPPDQKESIQQGRTSLRDVFENAPEWYICTGPNGPGEPTAIELQQSSLPQDELPHSDHYLTPENYEWEDCFPFGA